MRDETTPHMRRLMILDWREVTAWLDGEGVERRCTETLLQRILRYVHDAPTLSAPCVQGGDAV